MKPQAIAIGCLAAIAAAAPPLASAQQLGGAPELELPLIRLAVGFLFCCLIAVVAVLALKRHVQAGGTHPLQLARSFLRSTPRKVRVIETHRISPHADLCVFASGKHEYLVVVSASGATVIETSEVTQQAAAS